MVYNTQHSEIHYDPIESVHEEPLIEKIVEDPPHVTSTENSGDWECFHDYFSDDDHICTQDLPQDEAITEAYHETHDENVMCMMGLLHVLHIMMIVWKVYCLVTFFSKKMSMKMRTSIT